MASGVQKGRISGDRRHGTVDRGAGGFSGGAEWLIAPPRSIRVDQRTVYPTSPRASPEGSRCWRCGQVPRSARLLEQETPDLWRCVARRACDQRGVDPLRGGQV